MSSAPSATAASARGASAPSDAALPGHPEPAIARGPTVTVTVAADNTATAAGESAATSTPTPTAVTHEDASSGEEDEPPGLKILREAADNIVSSLPTDGNLSNRAQLPQQPQTTPPSHVTPLSTPSLHPSNDLPEFAEAQPTIASAPLAVGSVTTLQPPQQLLHATMTSVENLPVVSVAASNSPTGARVIPSPGSQSAPLGGMSEYVPLVHCPEAHGKRSRHHESVRVAVRPHPLPPPQCLPPHWQPARPPTSLSLATCSGRRRFAIDQKRCPKMVTQPQPPTLTPLPTMHGRPTLLPQQHPSPGRQHSPIPAAGTCNKLIDRYVSQFKHVIDIEDIHTRLISRHNSFMCLPPAAQKCRVMIRVLAYDLAKLERVATLFRRIMALLVIRLRFRSSSEVAQQELLSRFNARAIELRNLLVINSGRLESRSLNSHERKLYADMQLNNIIVARSIITPLKKYMLEYVKKQFGSGRKLVPQRKHKHWVDDYSRFYYINQALSMITLKFRALHDGLRRNVFTACSHTEICPRHRDQHENHTKGYSRLRGNTTLGFKKNRISLKASRKEEEETNFDLDGQMYGAGIAD